MDQKNTTSNILVIDDGEIDNIIFEKVVKRVMSNSNIDACYDAKSAIDKLMHISNTAPHLFPDYIFLDLTMPVMDGWDFLDEYRRLNIDPLKQSKIYLLSSSISIKDINRSRMNPLVFDFISKPMNRQKAEAIFEVS
ncbi:response regulator [Mucilaginibacter sp. KACC 22773]|jgi:CheY-like chemotaxis protein|uniref:response regulator n=1 Tax=Mucilaginibacter sp. KACC 22773 TaxID=3025671 RepID=UPI0023654D93|nr:response regulator [Mucilaginibacter sp. KACC 22773]WDF79792.1 response regulator [Mucilaginibacter sp. KACC 22773]